MSSRLRAHIRSNVIGYIALFFALSTGSAVALDGSNTVFTDDIVNNAVRSVDVRDDTLADGGLGAVDLAAGSVGSSEVADDSLGALDLAPDSVTSSETAINSVASSEVVDNSLTRNDIDGESLHRAAGNGARFCDPNNNTLTCSSVTLALPTESDVLVIASGRWFSNGVGSNIGECILTRGLLQIRAFSDSVRLGARGSDHIGDGFARNGIDQNVPAGNTTWNLRCSEVQPDIEFHDLQMTAVALTD